ncbi:MAG: hypothetical protein ABEJ58_10955 [Halodesulfurarchaeum sp.]
MSDTRSGITADSGILQTWWVLNTQFHATVSDPRATVLFAVGAGAAILFLVAGTLALLGAFSPWWVGVVLLGAGTGIIVVGWSMAFGDSGSDRS